MILIMKKEYDLWAILIKPFSVVLAMVIGVFILRAIFSWSKMVLIILIAVLSFSWLIYYYKFEFEEEEKDEEIADEV